MNRPELRQAYAVLGLSPPVTASELKSQYRELVKMWHPDRFQNDPAAQKEATERLRDINVAYRLLEGTLESPEALEPTPIEWPPRERRAFSSRAYVDEIVDAINRFNEWTLVPDMSLNRWLSLGALALYFIVFTWLIGSAMQYREIGRAAGAAFAYFWLPMFLIWLSDSQPSDAVDNVAAILFRTLGWMFMALPAVLGVLWVLLQS
jgi:hypothetical protein